MRASSSVETISMKSFLARQKQQKKPARSAHATRKETCPAVVVWARTYVTIVIITTARLLLRAANEQAQKQGRQGPVSQAKSSSRLPWPATCNGAGIVSLLAAGVECKNALRAKGFVMPCSGRLGGHGVIGSACALRLKSEARLSVKGRENVAGGEEVCDSFLACLQCCALLGCKGVKAASHATVLRLTLDARQWCE